MGTMGMNASLKGSIPSQNDMSSGQSAWDSRGSSIRSQIKRLQEEIKSVAKDDKLSEEQKSKQKQALQQELQDLNSQLRQHQLEKRQEEIQKKQEKEEAKADRQKETTQAASGQKADAKDTQEDQKMFGSEQLGVIITISLSKDQVTYLKNMRKDLEKQQKAAGTEEERENVRTRMENVSKGMGQKIIITEEGIKNSQKDNKFGTGVVLDEKKEEDTRTLPGKKMIVNQNEPFENVSVVIR